MGCDSARTLSAAISREQNSVFKIRLAAQVILIMPMIAFL
jgi:hypothetical protein